MEVLRAVPIDAIEWPELDDGLLHEDRQLIDLDAVDYEDFAKEEPEKTRWIGKQFLRIWFQKVR